MTLHKKEVKRRKQGEMLEDDVRITEMYLAGKTQVEIAEAIGKSQPTVSRAISRIHQRWLESPLVNFNEAKMRELAAIDKVENAAWEAWLRSQEEKLTRTTTGTKGQPSTATIRTEQQNGDSPYLNIILKCSEQRSKLLGLIVTRQEAVLAHDAGTAIDSFSGMFKVIGQREKKSS
jgi:ParB-like chromosome segregation protein Spo0J